MTGEDHAESIDTLQFINDELTGRAGRQSDAGKSIDAKAGILAGFAAAATQFLAARHGQLALTIVAFVAYGVAFGFAVWALSLATYQDVPDAVELVNTYAREPKDRALRDLIVERARAIKNNEAKQKKKARRWWIALAALVVGLVVSVVAIVETDDRDAAGATQQRQPTTGGVGHSAAARGA